MLSHVRLLVTPWTVARQTPLSILQAGILEWVAMPSRGSSQPRSTSLPANSLPTELPGKCWRSLQKEQLYSQGEHSDSLVMFSRNSHVWIEIVLFSAYALCPLNLVLLKNRMVQMPNSMMVLLFFFFFSFCILQCQGIRPPGIFMSPTFAKLEHCRNQGTRSLYKNTSPTMPHWVSFLPNRRGGKEVVEFL